MQTIFTKPQFSKVNARQLLTNWAEGYSHATDEAVVVEVVANALDADASQISFEVDQARSILVVQDNGRGMTAEDFHSYHDLAESTKVRGQGIGFAGLGSKLAHTLTSKVITETRSAEFSGATDWHWKGPDLEYRPVRRRQLQQMGTRVSLELNRSGHRLLDSDFIEATLRKHFGPLLDPDLSNLYVWESVYPRGVEFVLNSTRLPHMPLIDPRAGSEMAFRDILDGRRKRIGRAIFAVVAERLPEELQGIAIATYGKVIKRDALGFHPRAPERVVGWVEVPRLVECLTTNKQDFVDHGSLGEKYRRLRRSIQKVYGDWLAKAGLNVDAREARQAPRTLEREMSEILRRIPELRLAFATTVIEPVVLPSLDGSFTAESVDGIQITARHGEGSAGTGEVPTTPGPDEGQGFLIEPTGPVPARTRTRRTRRGPNIRLIPEPERSDMGWITGDTVFVNTAHVGYVKAQRESQIRYHRRLIVLLTLCEEAPVTGEQRLGLLARAIAQWGME